ncbi:MAG: class I SAM-dependent methyltransferase [Patescibacteria group bacterium]
MAAHYDDPSYSYEKYWTDRQYEHDSEVIAIQKLLEAKTFKTSADIGGGFGRLTGLISDYSKKTLLIEPSKKQRRLTENHLAHHTKIAVLPGSIERTGLENESLDLALVVRVMHHLPDPKKAFSELSRIVKPGGFLILEFANSLNFKSRLHSLWTGQSILPSPIERRSNSNIRKQTIPFVNHHPDTVFKYLKTYDFTPIQTLSVSNFRYAFFKKYVSKKALLSLESFTQKVLSSLYFGPSIFILAKRLDNQITP